MNSVWSGCIFVALKTEDSFFKELVFCFVKKLFLQKMKGGEHNEKTYQIGSSQGGCREGAY